MSEQENRIRMLIISLFFHTVVAQDFIGKCVQLENENDTQIIAMEILAIPNTTSEMKFVSQLCGPDEELQKWIDFTGKEGMRNDTATTYDLAVEHLEKVRG